MRCSLSDEQNIVILYRRLAKISLTVSLYQHTVYVDIHLCAVDHIVKRYTIQLYYSIFNSILVALHKCPNILQNICKKYTYIYRYVHDTRKPPADPVSPDASVSSPALNSRSLALWITKLATKTESISEIEIPFTRGMFSKGKHVSKRERETKTGAGTRAALQRRAGGSSSPPRSSWVARSRRQATAKGARLRPALACRASPQQAAGFPRVHLLCC